MFKVVSSDSYAHTKLETYAHMQTKKYFMIFSYYKRALRVLKNISVKFIAYVLQQQYVLELKQGLLIYRWTTHWFQLCISTVYARSVTSSAHEKFVYSPRVLEGWNFLCGFGPPLCMRLFWKRVPLPSSGGLKPPKNLNNLISPNF